jgi:hypothetical protein
MFVWAFLYVALDASNRLCILICLTMFAIWLCGLCMNALG